MNENEKIRELIGKFEEEYEESKSYVQIQSNKKAFTEDEKNIIDNHPEIFFQASKSRILLVVWLCKILRNTFELYGYSDLDMPNEAYEILRNTFKTKAFNRTGFLFLFDEKTVLPYKDFVDSEMKYIKEYNKYAPPSKKLSLMPHIRIKPESEELTYNKELSAILTPTRNTDIIYMRAKGDTLDNIGTRLGITRERARQLELKPKTGIERWIASREEDLLKHYTKNGMLNQKKLESEFGERNWLIIKYVISANSKNDKLSWKYYPILDILYYSKNQRLEDIFNKTNEQLSERIVDDFVSEFTKEIYNAGFPFWTEELTQKAIKKNKLNIYDKKLQKGKITIGKGIKFVSKEYFPEGIKVTDKKQLKIFADKMNETFNLNVEAGRALLTRIQDSLVMCDKGTYISNKDIVFPEHVLNKITNYINTMEEEKITYESLFNIFKNELESSTNIRNHYYLHGVLKFFARKKKANIICYRYYVGKNKTEKTKSKEFFRVFYNYLKQQKEPQQINNLLKQFPSWTEMYFRYSMIYFPSICQWDKDSYFCIESIKLEKEDIDYIDNIINKSMDNKINYTNSYVIYNIIFKENSDLLKKLNVKNEGQLFHIIQFLFNDKYYCRRPHILKECNKLHFSSQDLVKLVIGKQEVVNKKELTKELTRIYGNKNSSVNLAIQNELESYMKISKYEYIKKSKIKLTDEELENISKIIKREMIKGEVLLPISIKDFSEFPSIKYNWNQWVLCGIIEKYDMDFKIIGNPNVPSQTPMAIILKSNSKLNNKSDVFNWLLKNDYNGDMNLSEIFKYAKQIKIFHSNLTIDDIRKIIGGNK